MQRVCLIVFLVPALCLGLTACVKVDSEVPHPLTEIEGLDSPLAMATTGLGDAIPAEYGDLKAAYYYPRNWQFAQLWFQKQDGTIVVVWVDQTKWTVLDKAVVIPRH